MPSTVRLWCMQQLWQHTTGLIASTCMFYKIKTAHMLYRKAGIQTFRRSFLTRLFLARIHRQLSCSSMNQHPSTHPSLWPPKARPQGHYILPLLFIFYFVSTDERPAMWSDQTWSVGRKWSICKCPQKFRGPSPKIWGAKNKFWTTFSATSALDTAYLLNETKHRQTKMLVSIYYVSPKNLTYIPFDPETAKISWLHARLH